MNGEEKSSRVFLMPHKMQDSQPLDRHKTHLILNFKKAELLLPFMPSFLQFSYGELARAQHHLCHSLLLRNIDEGSGDDTVHSNRSFHFFSEVS